MRRTLNDEVLRALGHVRARVDAGHGNETILHALAEDDFGSLSRRVRPILKGLQAGNPMETLSRTHLRRDSDRPQDRPFRMLLTLLMSDGQIQGERLDNIEREILEVLLNQAEDHAKRVKVLAYIAILVVMGTSLVVSLARVVIKSLRDIEEQNMEVPFVMAPPSFDPSVLYTPALILFFALLVFMVRWR